MKSHKTYISQYIEINCTKQTLHFYEDNVLVDAFQVSTAKNGCGEKKDSFCTPRGYHKIRAKIGEGIPLNTVFVGRRPTGEIYSPALCEIYPGRDWILTRILWLSGTEIGKNRLGEVDTMARYIYIHGSPDETPMGIPGSRGCIRMHNDDMIQLFQTVQVGAKLFICE